MRRRFLRLLLAFAFVLVWQATPGRARAANDPRLEWRTIETAHFKISYYSGEREAAVHVADLAEAIHRRLAPVLAWQPKEKTQIALSDQTENANGVASGIPYNAIRLFLTAPSDLSPLGDVDDWYQELLTHEYTHTLHVDQIRGIPALVNAILGKTLAPNQSQPRFILEGIAVYMESSRTSGGRLRSSTWNMYMRTDVLADNVATLDRMSNSPRRWPQGTIWYLYGSFFMSWIAETYGDEAIAHMMADYGSEIVPLGINRSLRRATGKTFEELYPAWVASMQERYGAEARRIRARGVREGRRITFSGQVAEHPRWVPRGSFPDFEGGIVYFRDDARSTPGLYALPLPRDARGGVRGIVESPELVVRTNGVSSAAFGPHGDLIFDSVDVSNRIFPFGDLFWLDRGETSTGGLEDRRKRLSHGIRARDPDWSQDGRHLVFATNTRGTSYLQMARVGPDGLGKIRTLVPSYRHEQVYGPRFSPDGHHVAYSVWTKGGYRDIRYVDADTGKWVLVAHDRAMDGGPAFSADGKTVYFHSDRTGVMNIFAWDTETHELWQVTNVVTGAYQPAPSPDDKTLVYLGYTKAGFDLFAMPIDRSTWTRAEPYVYERPPPPPEPAPVAYEDGPYQPLDTLRPRNYSIQITPGNFGQAFIGSIAGTDIAGMHSVTASLRVESDLPEPQASVGYVYGRLPFDFGIRGYRSLTPQSGFALGDRQVPWVMESVGIDSGLTFPLPRAFASQTASVTYSAARLAGKLPFDAEPLNPYDTPSIPDRGMLGSVSLGWSYTNSQAFLWSVGAEKGFSLSANVTATHPALASQYQGFAATTQMAVYFRMPWLRHHALALHAGGGTSDGRVPGRGPFFVGGFVDLPLVDTVRNILIQGGIALRGYPPVVLAGRHYALFNAEYRFPIVNVDHGLSTLPLYLQRISGAVFLDYGSAFTDAESAKFKTGSGAELWFESTLGYFATFNFRLGYARGWASGGIDKVYFVAAIPF